MSFAGPKLVKRYRKGYIKNIVSIKQPKSLAAEAYRTIRTNIEFSGFERELKTLLITSSVPNEGKSTFTGNLGYSIAMTGKEVLILDADLRKPTQQKYFNVGNSTGLTSLLISGNLQADDVIKKTEVENLFVLTSGPLPPNPAELLTSHKMRLLFEHLSSRFEIILVDSPPVMAVSDPAILASYLDGVILLARYGGVSREEALSTKKQLQNVKANILGVVINNVPMNSKGYHYQYYYGKH